jgi:pimeloyl-ACP methyl ester carboxylesterase
MEKSLKFSQYGSDNGQLVIYFHGAPGAIEECAIFDSYAKTNNLTFICFDRFSVDASIVGQTYYQFLATEILKKASGEKVDIIGFSIGAFIALQTCRYLNDNVRNLHLISAAAPLEAGDFLNKMAGKHVFRLAKTFPVFFVLLSYWQGVLARYFPNALFSLLFANVTGKDKELVVNKEFHSTIIKTSNSCFTGNIRGYIREIETYVKSWKNTLPEITVNTHIWHGADDNWSPKLMAIYLKSAIPNCSHLEIADGLSHYSCLYETAAKICNHLGEENHEKTSD